MSEFMKSVLAVPALALVLAANAQASCPTTSEAPSSMGCVFHAVDLDNDDIDESPFSIVAVNPESGASVGIEVQIRVGGVWQSIASATIPPGAHHSFELPDRHIEGTGHSVAGAYRIVSDSRVAAFQFQSGEGSGGASLLLPENALGGDYHLTGWGPAAFSGTFSAQLVIVALSDATSVTITPRGGATLGGGPIPPMTVNVPTALPFTLAAGDFVQITSNQSLAGTLVEADRPVAVFSAHACALVPDPTAFCDHVEEQIPRRSTWGKTHVVGRMAVRNVDSPETTYWQIVGNADGTQITYLSGPGVVLSGAPTTIDEGQAALFQVTGTSAHPGDFIVNSTAPIALAEYMSGSTNVPAAVGDPAMVQAVPVEQHRSDYVVFVPSAWDSKVLTVTKPSGTSVSIDGVPIAAASFSVISESSSPVWEVARVSIAAGRHAISGSQPFGITIAGYTASDASAMPGGMNQIDLPEPGPIPGLQLGVLGLVAWFRVSSRLKSRRAIGSHA